MSVPYIQPWINIVTFLTESLGMYLFTELDGYEIYRKEVKGHIVTVHLKVDSCIEGDEVKTFLNINGANIWWHKHKDHTGYTLRYMTEFVPVDFVRIIIRNSDVFKEDWKDYSDL